MKVVHELERSTCLHNQLRGRVELSTEKLNVLGNSTTTATVHECDLMDAVCVKDEHGRMTRDWFLAKCTGVVELNF